MKANACPFSFIHTLGRLNVPYFQRRYVWNDNNWSELLDQISDCNGRSNFLGSIILVKNKTANENDKKQESTEYSIIDGQQRLTTLSILVKALVDRINSNPDEFSFKQKKVNSSSSDILFMESGVDEDDIPKLKLSVFDNKNYLDVLNDVYLKEDEFEKINDDSTSNILLCYRFFRNALNTMVINKIESIFKLLTSPQQDLESTQIFVVIILNENDDEQAIFDTVNTAGVRLTSADTIKNALFDAVTKRMTEESALELYNRTWKSTFENSESDIKYWNEPQLGKSTKVNLENLLHCFATIEGIYDPEKNILSDLPDVYKKYLVNKDKDELIKLIEDICGYSITYRKVFDIDGDSFKFEDKTLMLLKILTETGTTAYNPYVLWIYKECNEEERENNYSILSSYLMWQMVCRVSNKNFNKEVPLLLSGKKTITDIFIEKLENTDSDMSLDNLIAGLKSITRNSIANLILFFIELKRRFKNNKTTDVETLEYNYTLEHIMPTHFETNWNISALPVYDENGIKIENTDKAIIERKHTINQIGNMTLLKSSLNSQIRDSAFEKKIKGEGKKKGLEEYATLSITSKDIIEEIYYKNKKWDEKEIRLRTAKLTEEYLEIWPVPTKKSPIQTKLIQ